MTYGFLTVVAGPMSAGKTTSILKTVLWARNGENKVVRVFKPALDDRYAHREIVSHDGLRCEAESVTTLPDALDCDLVVIDEMQFFGSEIITWVQRHLAAGVDVFAAGLDMDWRGQPFEVSGQLLAMADEAVKQTAYCTICGKAAAKTLKLNQSGGSVELGGLSDYEARCNKHWSL